VVNNLYPHPNTPNQCDCMPFRKSKKEEKWEEKEAIKKEYVKVKPRKEGKEFKEEIDEELLPPPEDLGDKEFDEELLPPPEDLEEKGEKESLEEKKIEERFKKEKKIEEDKEEISPWRSAAWDLIKDVIIAFIIVIIIIGSIYVYTGNWPPVVVVESDSMQHSDTESFLGVIDTGDLVLVKKIDSRNDVVTYMEGKRIDHETYSEYGDVLIYRKNGYTETTPVIHRALVWLEYNETSHTFDIPELKYHDNGTGEEGDWYVLGGEQRWYNLSGTVVLKDIGYDHLPVSINLGSILASYQTQGVDPHSGFITLGDHNGGSYDQGGSMADFKSQRVRPIKPEWVIGKGRGELPWFGLIKLWFGEDTKDNAEDAPSNSWTMLYITLLLIIAVPICIDIFLILLERRKAKMEEEQESEEKEFRFKKEEKGAEEEVEEELGEKEKAEEGERSEEDTKEEELR
jgi:signal peptidase